MMTVLNLSSQQIRTRRALVNATIELIYEVGFEKLTIKAITDRADYGQRVFYLHFKDKQDILYHIITNWIQNNAEKIFAKIKHYPSPEREYRAFRLFARLLINQRDFLKKAFNGISLDFSVRLKAFAVENIKYHIDHGHIQFHSEISSETASQFHASMMQTLFIEILQSDQEVDIDQMVDDLFIYTFRQDLPQVND